MKLEIIKLNKKYGNKVAIKDISLELTPGIYGVLGANGAGKSTLMNILTDNLKRGSGKILYNGEEILQMGKRYRERLGYMPQQQGFYEQLSAKAFLLYMASMKGISRKEALRQIAYLLKVVNLSHVSDKKIASFSGGMKQRLLLSQALLGNPDIIILDEPTAGLDPKERIHMRNFIAELSENKIIIFATHVVSDIECIADRVILIKDGEILKMGAPSELICEIETKVYEKNCEKAELNDLKLRYPFGNVIQKKKGLVFRIAMDDMPEDFYKVGEDLNLEDVYLYYFGE